MKLSFVIPTLNEEKNIGMVLRSIKNNEIETDFEIIVVDNGSSDNTARIARAEDTNVIVKPGLTISALRNVGAAKATGDVIVFLDGDVHLNSKWGRNVSPVVRSLRQDPRIIAGSTYGLRENPTWVEKSWYSPVLDHGEHSHINGGHLIMNLSQFKYIGGFREDLETGEDYEFCQRARKMGSIIIHNSDLGVIHEGYPKTVREFFRRERWHGRGDYGTLKSFLSSKQAMLSLINLLVFFGSALAALFYSNLHYLLMYGVFLVCLCMSAAAFRCRKLKRYFLLATLLYVVYFLARGVAFLDVRFKRIRKNL